MCLKRRMKGGWREGRGKGKKEEGEREGGGEGEEGEPCFVRNNKPIFGGSGDEVDEWLAL